MLMHLDEGLEVFWHLASVGDAVLLDDPRSQTLEGRVTENAYMTLGVETKVPARSIAGGSHLVHVAPSLEQHFHDLFLEE